MARNHLLVAYILRTAESFASENYFETSNMKPVNVSRMRATHRYAHKDTFEEAEKRRESLEQKFEYLGEFVLNAVLRLRREIIRAIRRTKMSKILVRFIDRSVVMENRKRINMRCRARQ